VQQNERCFIFIAEPQREGAATAGLLARNFTAMCPMVYKARAVKDRSGRHLKDEHGKKIWKKIEEPMFRGYGLIMFPRGAERFEDARKVPGVARFLPKPGVGDRALASGDDKATLPASLVEAIRMEESRQLSAYELAQRNGSDKLNIPFVAGGPARIAGGPYDDWVGKMLKLSKSGRVTLLLSMLGGEVEVNVDGAQVIAA
jgi:transcription antitermination factor NusG